LARASGVEGSSEVVLRVEHVERLHLLRQRRQRRAQRVVVRGVRLPLVRGERCVEAPL
tara:strand:+ start:927 stop:1100 length:174 start_codon:yes stop_codon:yes gene_type:complete